ncbi:hypothetical protein AGOR_G00167130 [Albula goreensis]|uniref:Uncharacterized protein n=1 Tax=Albula goreensis TaxID=1534307 RepID=A0A8T3D0B3_9TELE|nr:hypothetical protein AGOR_G00167130 [Albula goreensis]
MVGVGTFLLLCLSLFCDRGESVLTAPKLQNIVAAMYNRFNQQQLIDDIKIINNRRPDNEMAAGNQYSVALQLSRKDCDNGQLGNNIPSDFSQVRETLKMEKVYNENSIVAALPHHKYKKINNQYQKLDQTMLNIESSVNYRVTQILDV